MYQQNPHPTGSLFLSALLALIPLVTVPFLFGALGSSGGVTAKMIPPQNLAIGTAAAVLGWLVP